MTPLRLNWQSGVLTAAGLTFAAWRHARGLEVMRYQLACPGLASPCRLVHLSDLHLAAFGPRERRLLRTVNALLPDLVCITGDLINADWQLPACAALLSGLSARCGKFAVPGNNERENPLDFDRFRTTLKNAGFRLLVNETVEPLPGLALLGLDDPLHGRPAPEAALASAPAGAFRLWLAHSPHIAYDLARFGEGLLLSGHTHGGQFRLPFGFAPVVRTPRLSHRHAAGFWRTGDLVVYVSRGYGYSLLPVRTFCRPEVALFELCPA